MRRGYFTGRYARTETNTIGVDMYTPDPLHPLAYHAADGRTFVMDRTFETDGATTGRLLGAIPGLGKWDWPRAALLHDWIWDERRTGQLAANFYESNKLLQEAIVALGWNRWLALAARWGCQLLGWVWWLRGERAVA